MGIKNSLKQKLLLIFSAFIILISMLSPIVTAFAGIEEAEQKFSEESSAFISDAKEAKDIIGLLEDDASKNPNPERNSISYVMHRLFDVGVYVNDVRDGVLANELKDAGIDANLYKDKYACNPNEPVNLLNHNCNIPNFTTGVAQNLLDAYTPAFENAEKTSAYSVFGLGVPSDIPGGIVPEDPNKRTKTYTALELYGYNLKLTSYNGEWDNVVASNSARMLSNFGVIDNITLIGTGVWNAVSSGMSTFVENFSFNPVRWFSSVGKSFSGGASSGINTVVDTSELNIVATNAWKRPRLDDSLYNVYVMTDAEILRETSMNYFKIFSEEFDKEIKGSSKLKEVVAINPDSALSSTPFSYDPKYETEESKKKREAAEEKRAKEEAHNEAERLKATYSNSEEPYELDIVSLTKIPMPVYYTESEQLGLWSKDPAVSKTIGTAKSNSLISKDPSEYKDYESMMKEWTSSYEPFFKKNFNALEETIEDITNKLDSDVFIKHPHLDPKQSISRYACANKDGSIKRGSDGSVEYLYEKNNSSSKEYLNEDCSEARPPIGGGLLGNGYGSAITDTRHKDLVESDGLFFKSISNTVGSAALSINSFTAKVTNVILDLSFSPLMEKLGVSKIVSGFVEGMKDTIFFPLSTLAATIGALLLFFQALKSSNMWQILASFGITIMIFVAGTTFLIYPESTVKVIDELPSKIDNIVADTILNQDDGSKYCTTGSTQDGIRSAQCNVWGAMVFEPWVALQFGTSYNNLYANGYAKKGGTEFNNKNTDLVGSAAVKMGGGVTEHNWAMYQLESTKAGTINSKPTLSSIGTVDKDLYRLVDLQAGPENGKNSDSKYFKSWNGENRNGLIIFLTVTQSILLGVAICLIGIAKIEVSFIFSILIIFLPFFLLYALLPQGRGKLIGYLANMISLLLKKIILVAMLAILLKIITLTYSNSSNLIFSSLIGIFISVAFIIYRKELLEMLTFNKVGSGVIGSDTNRMKEAAKNSIPNGMKQWYYERKSEAKGIVAGSVGGALGSASNKMAIRRERSDVRRQIKAVEKEIKKDSDNQSMQKYRDELLKKDEAISVAISRAKGLSPERAAELESNRRKLELEIQENEAKIKELIAEDKKGNVDEISSLYSRNLDLERKQREIDIEHAGGARDSSGVIAQILEGATHSRNVIGRNAERKMRREGYAGLTSYRDVTDAVYAQGAKDITEMKDPTEYDVYKDVYGRTKDGKGNPTDSGQLKNPQLQRQVRELAEERRKAILEARAHGNISADNFSASKLTPDEIDEAARYLESRKTVDKLRQSISAPTATLETHNRESAMREERSKQSSDVKEIISQIERDIEQGNGAAFEQTPDGRQIAIDARGAKMKNEDIEYKNKLEEINKRKMDAEEKIRQNQEQEEIKQREREEENK